MPIITRRIRTLSFEDVLARFPAFSRKTFSPGTKTFRGFLFRRSVSVLVEQEKMFVLSVHDYFRGWNNRSLLLNTFHWQHSPTFLFCVSWPILLSQSFHSGHWSCASQSSDQCVVLPWSSIFDSLDFDQLTVWSWTESSIFSLYKPSRAADRASSHLVSKSWVSSPCRKILKRSDRCWTAS